MNLYSHARMFWSLVFSVCVFGDIIREDHFFKGEFSNNHKGRMLRVLMVFNNLPLDQCAVKCIQHIQCKTVNYNHEKAKCELTDVDFNDDEADKLSYDWYNYGTQPKVNGGWGQWRNVTRCTATCNGGTMNQARDCDSPKPNHGGDFCVGNGERTVDCNSQPCPVQGKWGAWTNTSSCNANCDGGTLSQTRECNSPKPQDGGDDCSGNSTRTVPCNTHACPVTNVALNKVARQSSTSGGLHASLGNDGNRQTYSMTKYKATSKWWSVDLGADMKVDHIIFRTLENNKVDVKGKSTNGDRYDPCPSSKSLERDVDRFVCDSTKKYRYVKLEMKQQGVLYVNELEVYVKQT